MAMTIGTNSASLTAARSLHESAKDMQTAMERLSTGSRINNAGDDAAGLAVVTQMESQVKSLNQVIKNINNGEALTEALEAGLEEAGDMLARMRELAVQASTDTFSDSDRVLMNNEMIQLRNELTALTQRLEFNGTKLLDGSYNGKLIQVGDGANETISVTASSVAADQIGAFTKTGTPSDVDGHASDTVENSVDGLRTDDTGYFNITGNGTTTTTNYATSHDQDAKDVAAAVNAETGTHGVTATAVTKAHLTVVVGGTANSISIGTSASDGTAPTLTSISDFSTVDDAVNNINAKSATTGIVATKVDSTKLILTDADGDDIAIQNRNANGGNHVTVQQYSTDALTGSADDIEDAAAAGSAFIVVSGLLTLSSDADFSVTITDTHDVFMGSSAGTTTATSSKVSAASLSTQSNASSAIAVFEGALSRVASMRADLGAISNRLGHALDSTIVLRDMTANAAATIGDADYSQESANLAKAQVAQQVGTAMLAQANAQPQLVLQLVQ